MYALIVLISILLLQSPLHTTKPKNAVVKNSKADNKADQRTQCSPVVPFPVAVSTPMGQPSPAPEKDEHRGETDKGIYRVDVIPHSFDWRDALYLVYILATAGAAFFAWRALLAIREQARLMKDQLIEIRKTRQRTVIEMQNAGEQTNRLIGHAESQVIALVNAATAAKTNADVAQDNLEMFINRERARLRIEVDSLQLIPAGSGLAHTVTYKILFYGFTDAFVVSSAHYAVATKEPDPNVDSDLVAGIFSMRVPQVIRTTTATIDGFQFIFPEMRLTQTTIDGINNGSIFVHFFGFIKYKDVFGRERETRFCYTWKADPKPVISGLKFEVWAKSGSPDANLET
jgi:hypothetical protein